MKTLGLDIGTTTISAVVYDNRKGVVACRTICNHSFLSGKHWERLQDPALVFDISLSAVRTLIQEFPEISAIGLSGQMHGILYLDSAGNPVSPLFTWQDGRGDLSYDGSHSWAAHLSGLTGYDLATGYGMVTHYYNLNHGLVPDKAAVLCTIQDYLAMKLSGQTCPLLDASNAASLGLYDALHHRFDAEALQRSGMNPSILPLLAADPCLGTGILGIPVYTALGDNQASFLGAAGGRTDILLVNMGTGGQISIHTPDYLLCSALETRPFPDSGWLLVGASLCGGKSYALLEGFFRETVKMVTGSDNAVYEAMSMLLSNSPAVTNYPKITTLFQGTRKNPALRGSIANIGTDNFTPLHLIYGIMYGMAEELHAMYQDYLHLGGKAPAVIIGSGNGLRKNPHLCRVFEDVFGAELILSKNQEEAACGAAIYAAKHFK